MEPAPATIGKYQVVREIGRGATATVYEARHPKLSRSVAIKLVRFDGGSRDGSKLNRRLLKLLRAEETVARRLDHPNIISIYEVVTEPDQAYVVMEYFPGATLEKFCGFERRLPVPRVIGIMFKCCMALDYIYRQGIVHRDIKPANILVNDNDDVRITDFGLALDVDKQIEVDSTFIMGVGSPAYMSPEQVKGYPLDHKTDLYSLGVVTFHLLTGRLPFRAVNPAQLVYKIINTDPPSVAQLNPDASEQMNAVIRKAMEKDLYSRYKNGAEFAKDLSAARYEIVEDKSARLDAVRFSTLREQTFFSEFDDVELWEILRISIWRTARARVKLLGEGDVRQRFGVLLEGRIELSIGARRIMELGPGAVFGETAWLDRARGRQAFSVVSLAPLVYLEINPAALALASDEIQKIFTREVAAAVASRLGALAAAHAEHCPPAAESHLDATGGHTPGGFGLHLAKG
ncbi:MAG: protein kinase [Azoarcus sp.]|jgi:non-specific serine/threonine protein kinase|nr:protein kinase [Azoarcus sp.]